MSDAFFNISGFALGVLGVFGTFQLVYLSIRHYLPYRRVNVLEKTFNDAHSLFRSGVEEGLFFGPKLNRMELRLRKSRAKLNAVRAQAVCIGGFWKQFIAMFSTLTTKMGCLAREIQNLHMEIASNSQKARKQLEEQGLECRSCLDPLPSPHSQLPMHPEQGIDSKVPSSSLPSEPPKVASWLQCRPACEQSDEKTFDCGRSRVPTHKDSVSSVSTSATAVEDELDTAPNEAGEDSKSVHPPSILFREPSEEPTSILADGPSHMHNIRSHTETLISEIRYLLRYRQDLEDQGVATESDLWQKMDEISHLEPYFSKLSQAWGRTQTDAILPI